MSYYAGNLSPISDFMENNNSPAMDKLVESAAMLRGKQNIFNIGLEKDNVLSAIKGDTLRELGEIQRDMYKTIKSNNDTSQMWNTIGQGAGFASSMFGSGGGAPGGGGTFSSPSSHDFSGLYTQQPVPFSTGF